MAEDNTFEMALLTLASVRAALANGVKHYHPDGHLLNTDKDILEALVLGAKVTIDERDRVNRVTAETLFADPKQQTPRH